MASRRNPPVTAEVLLRDLSSQMEHMLDFLETDLTPAIIRPKIAKDSPCVVDLISAGASSSRWILRLRTILEWSSLASEEEHWLQAHEMELAPPGSHIQGVWLMPSFLRHLGRSNDHNARSDLQQGRKLRRMEVKLGTGIALVLAPVMPTFRRLSLAEEAKFIQLLVSDYPSILCETQRLRNLKMKYQTLVSQFGLGCV
ncbi:hypothetical protein N7520_001599 [Penicillium odoratum]|jgi:hypothetical protein|uniref:uncharacterized protein n=1 Tax=Penicillium odoratum TaxID=1167516 RepID=UPI002549A8E2|nr:uncharacterized protein N7520_001599 [Penicillium odoratum]KAJ5778353.1 hypothetical protein N7520_001599 [Penicillium odoratum]